MFVKDFMTNDPIVISPQASISSVADLMKKNGLKRLPVLDCDTLVGLVTEADLMKALPSPATTLSKHEINYLTSKITVDDIMSTKVITTTPNTTVEEAVMVMRHHDIGCLPVLEDQKIAGIITESNVFEALTRLLGLHRAGLRITVQVQDKLGVLAELTSIIRDLGITIISVVSFPSVNNSGTLIFRLATGDAESVIKAIEAYHFTVLHWTTLN